jgi:hypothetical protein
MSPLSQERMTFAGRAVSASHPIADISLRRSIADIGAVDITQDEEQHRKGHEPASNFGYDACTQIRVGSPRCIACVEISLGIHNGSSLLRVN